MSSNPKGSPHRNTPEAKRGGRKVAWRVSPARIAAVKDFARDERETEALVADALLAFGLRHRAEVSAEIQARKAAPEKSTGG